MAIDCLRDIGEGGEDPGPLREDGRGSERQAGEEGAPGAPGKHLWQAATRVDSDFGFISDHK